MSQSDKLGTYEVIRQIAVGAMAELYLARTVGMEGFEKLVCVKRILPQYIDNPNFVNMFLGEARLAATLHHANIVQIYDIGHEDGECFVAMEYVHGEDLGRLVATARESGVPISLDCALTLASGLCAGLHHAHEKASPEGKPLGVVHRDVSPTNVLVSYDGAVKLVDFGIARAIGEPMASGNGMKGKIAYMSPEQCRGKAALDRRSDVFSIGTILYELTTGRRPFVDESEYGVLQQIVNRDAEPPSKLVPGYPAALEAIVMRALSREVTRRFSTALELQNQLEDFAHDNRLRVSPLVLARLMSTLFPARLEEWDHARAQGAFFVEQHVVRTLIESGKTPSAAPHYVPQPLPPAADELSGAAHAQAPTVPAGRGSAPGIAPQIATPGAATQIGPPPVAPTRLPTPPPGELRRMSTPPPGELTRNSSPMPVATPVSQPRLPTPPPMPGVQPLPGVRYASMPVPNMPGAVPIVMPRMAPPSGGTLVSSALQAGTSPTASVSGPIPAGTVPGVAMHAGVMPGSGMPGAPMAGGPMPGAPMRGGPMPGSGMPGAPMAGGPMPGAPMRGGPMPGSGMPGAPMAGGPMPGAPMRGGPMPGGGMPAGAMPGSAMPGAAMPGGGMPAGVMPGSPMQGASMPGAAMPGVPVRMTPPGYVPAAAGDVGPGETGRRAAVAYGGYGPSGGMGDPGQVGADPAYAAHAAGGPVPVRRRSADARPTLIVRIHRRRWVPITAVAVAGVAGAIAVMLVINGGSGSTATPDPGAAPAAAMPSGEAPRATDSPTTPANAESAAAPSAAAPGAASAPASAGTDNPGGEVARPTEAATAATAGAVAGAATTGGAPSSAAGAGTSGAPSAAVAPSTAAASAPAAAETAPSSAAGAAPGAAASPATPGAAPAANAAGLLPATSDTKKRSAKLVPQDSRKPARPRVRPDAKRADPKRAPKSEAKEQSWNDDSPFMPVQTPKR